MLFYTGRMEPPNKRPRLDSSPAQPSTLTPSPVPPNIRVQALYPGSSSSSSSFSPPFTTPQLGFQNSTPIASLLDKRNLPHTTINSNHLESKPPPTSLANTHKLFLSDSGDPTSIPPPPYNFNPSSMLIGQSSSQVKQPGSQLAPSPVTQSSQAEKQLQPSLLPSLSVNTSRTQSSSQGHTTATKVADTINSNSRSVVLQLMQLYKQYQALNDRQGMGRVRDQLNLLVSAQQKILAAQNSAGKTDGTSLATSSSGSVSNQLSHQSSGPSKSASLGASGSVGEFIRDGSPSTQQQHQQQQQRANQILGQLAAVKHAPSPPSSSTVNMPWQGGVSMTSSSVTTSTTHITTGGSDWQSGAPKVPPPPYSQASGISGRPSSSNLQSSPSVRVATPPSAPPPSAPPPLSYGGPSGTTSTATPNNGKKDYSHQVRFQA